MADKPQDQVQDPRDVILRVPMDGRPSISLTDWAKDVRSHIQLTPEQSKMNDLDLSKDLTREILRGDFGTFPKEQISKMFNRPKTYESFISGAPKTETKQENKSPSDSLINSALEEAGRLAPNKSAISTPLLKGVEPYLETAAGTATKAMTNIPEKVWGSVFPSQKKKIAAASDFTAGFMQGATDTAVGMTSPLNLATLVAMKYLKGGGLIIRAARAIVMGNFTADMLADLPIEFAQFKEAWKKGDYNAAGRYFAKGTGDALFAAGMGKETVEAGLGEYGRYGPVTKTPPRVPTAHENLEGKITPGQPGGTLAERPGGTPRTGTEASGRPIESENPELVKRIAAERERLAKKGKLPQRTGPIAVPRPKAPAQMTTQDIDKEVGTLQDHLNNLKEGTPEHKAVAARIAALMSDPRYMAERYKASPKTEGEPEGQVLTTKERQKARDEDAVKRAKEPHPFVPGLGTRVAAEETGELPGQQVPFKKGVGGETPTKEPAKQTPGQYRASDLGPENTQGQQFVSHGIPGIKDGSVVVPIGIPVDQTIGKAKGTLIGVVSPDGSVAWKIYPWRETVKTMSDKGWITKNPHPINIPKNEPPAGATPPPESRTAPEEDPWAKSEQPPDKRPDVEEIGSRPEVRGKLLNPPEKRKPGRPSGSKNKPKAPPEVPPTQPPDEGAAPAASDNPPPPPPPPGAGAQPVPTGEPSGAPPQPPESQPKPAQPEEAAKPPQVTPVQLKLQAEIERVKAENERLKASRSGQPTPAEPPQPRSAATPGTSPGAQPAGEPTAPVSPVPQEGKIDSSIPRSHMDTAAWAALQMKAAGSKRARIIFKDEDQDPIRGSDGKPISAWMNPQEIDRRGLEEIARQMAKVGAKTITVVAEDKPNVKIPFSRIEERDPRELANAKKNTAAKPPAEPPKARASAKPPVDPEAATKAKLQAEIDKLKASIAKSKGEPPPARTEKEKPIPLSELKTKLAEKEAAEAKANRPTLTVGSEYPIKGNGNEHLGLMDGDKVKYLGQMRNGKQSLVVTDPDGQRSPVDLEVSREELAEALGVNVGDLKKKNPLVGESQFKSNSAVTNTGKIKLGADVASLGKVLGSSLYTGKEVHVVTKELMQNAFDAVRGVPNGEVKVKYDRSNNSITISDNGKGMTARDLGTIFTDLGASGKRGMEDASGGFGLAKAAPLMMSKQITVESVVDDNGRKILSSFTAKPDQLLNAGVDMHQEVVPQSTPTGTKVISEMPSNARGWYEAEDFVRNSKKSINMPGKLTTDGIWLEDNPRVLRLIKDLEMPGSAAIKVYASDEKKGFEALAGMVPIEVNNHGIFQFNSQIYLGGGTSLKGVPAVIAIDIKSLVPEGDPNYPFAANRESLRGDSVSKVREYVMNEIINPAIQKGNEFIEHKYNSLPRMNSGINVPIFDSGSRLNPEELSEIQKNKDMINLGDTISTMANLSIDNLKYSKVLPEDLTGLGSTIERSGFVFSKELHGVNVKNKTSGMSSIFVNPFSFDKGASPTEAASMLWHTIKHEILHDKVEGHHQAFTTGEVKVSQALGGTEIDSLLQLRDAYADPKDPTKFRSGINRALQIYTESRGRSERERDPFGGEESRKGTSKSERVGGQPPPIRGSGKEPVPGEGNPATEKRSRRESQRGSWSNKPTPAPNKEGKVELTGYGFHPPKADIPQEDLIAAKNSTPMSGFAPVHALAKKILDAAYKTSNKQIDYELENASARGLANPSSHYIKSVIAKNYYELMRKAGFPSGWPSYLWNRMHAPPTPKAIMSMSLDELKKEQRRLNDQVGGLWHSDMGDLLSYMAENQKQEKAQEGNKPKNYQDPHTKFIMDNLKSAVSGHPASVKAAMEILNNLGPRLETIGQVYPKLQTAINAAKVLMKNTSDKPTVEPPPSRPGMARRDFLKIGSGAAAASAAQALLPAKAVAPLVKLTQELSSRFPGIITSIKPMKEVVVKNNYGSVESVIDFDTEKEANDRIKRIKEKEGDSLKYEIHDVTSVYFQDESRGFHGESSVNLKGSPDEIKDTPLEKLNVLDPNWYSGLEDDLKDAGYDMSKNWMWSHLKPAWESIMRSSVDQIGYELEHKGLEDAVQAHGMISERIKAIESGKEKPKSAEPPAVRQSDVDYYKNQKTNIEEPKVEPQKPETAKPEENKPEPVQTVRDRIAKLLSFLDNPKENDKYQEGINRRKEGGTFGSQKGAMWFTENKSFPANNRKPGTAGLWVSPNGEIKEMTKTAGTHPALAKEILGVKDKPNPRSLLPSMASSWKAFDTLLSKNWIRVRDNSVEAKEGGIQSDGFIYAVEKAVEWAKFNGKNTISVDVDFPKPGTYYAVDLKDVMDLISNPLRFLNKSKPYGEHLFQPIRGKEPPPNR